MFFFFDVIGAWSLVTLFGMGLGVVEWWIFAFI